MSRIYGVVCDGCQKVDAVSIEEPMYDDAVPRNGWMSINVWNSGIGETKSKYPSVESEIHACSLDCIETIVRKLKTKL